jgi:hypothetical protein
MKYFKLGSTIKTRSPKCEENIMKSMKLIVSQVLFLLHGHGVTKRKRVKKNNILCVINSKQNHKP